MFAARQPPMAVGIVEPDPEKPDQLRVARLGRFLLAHDSFSASKPWITIRPQARRSQLNCRFLNIEPGSPKMDSHPVEDNTPYAHFQEPNGPPHGLRRGRSWHRSTSSRELTKVKQFP